MISYEKMNPGLEKFTYDKYNKTAYFARRNKWAIPFVVFGAAVGAICGGNPGGEYKQSLELLSSDKRSNKFYILALTCRMMYYRYAREFTCNEYILYDFENIDYRSRREYISLYERSRIFGMLSDKETLYRFKDKYNCFLEYKKYYKRDMVRIHSTADLFPFSQFVANHAKYIIKPNSSSCGKGVEVIDSEKNRSDTISVFKELLSSGGGVVEEYITQHDEMAVFHPGSVNTVRMTTFHKDGKTDIMYAMLRVGRHGNIVDNANSGGIALEINTENGSIVGDGYCEDGSSYTVHPDTGVVFKGRHLPKWNELLDMVNELVEVIPEQKLIAWDFACDKDKGWLVVEAGGVPNITAAQMCHKRGFRPVFAKTVCPEIPNGDLYATARL